jgi:hypothetical protein
MSIINSNCRRRPEEVLIVSFRAVTDRFMEVMCIINSNCRPLPEEIVYGIQQVARLLIAKIYCRRRLAKVIHGTLWRCYWLTCGDFLLRTPASESDEWYKICTAITDTIESNVWTSSYQRYRPEEGKLVQILAFLTKKIIHLLSVTENTHLKAIQGPELPKQLILKFRISQNTSILLSKHVYKAGN